MLKQTDRQGISNRPMGDREPNVKRLGVKQERIYKFFLKHESAWVRTRHAPGFDLNTDPFYPEIMIGGKHIFWITSSILRSFLKRNILIERSRKPWKSEWRENKYEGGTMVRYELNPDCL